jgi:hypothetical protein
MLRRGARLWVIGRRDAPFGLTGAVITVLCGLPRHLALSRLIAD